jgi:CysZ protein
MRTDLPVSCHQNNLFLSAHAATALKMGASMPAIREIMLKEIIIAIGAYGKAHRFISGHKLWRYIIIPGILYMLLFGTSMILFWNTATNAVAYLNNITGLRGWLEKMNSGWISFLVSFGELILTLLLLLFYFSLFKYLWLIIGSPLFAWLSEKTEALIEGKVYPFNVVQFVKDVLRGIRLAVRNTLWQTVYTIAILLLGIIPLVGWAAPMIALFVECYYYGFSMLDYSCERHKLGYAESIHYINHHKGLAIGNGMVFYIMHLLPVIGWVLAPAYAVVAATISIYGLKEDEEKKGVEFR